MVRSAGVVVAVQGVVALVIAVILVIRGFAGADQRIVSSYGTAGWFVIIGGGVLAAGWALWTGRRWGRGVAFFAQLLLLPIAWYMAVGSQRPEYGIPVAIIALGILALLFSPSALRWASGHESASSESADPDTR
jgi:peptidoglycan/LPS O-acetylase OafA/YrhL